MDNPVPDRRWLIAGAGGRLGREMRARLTARGAECVPLDRDGLDVTDARAVAPRDWRVALAEACRAARQGDSK
ncbi:sugar nucleotide-binding protein [Streptomyces sp. ISL-10]|nr:sugar nucleotide-binding protein [Streptomyces sp. ISL-10]